MYKTIKNKLKNQLIITSLKNTNRILKNLKNLQSLVSLNKTYN